MSITHGWPPQIWDGKKWVYVNQEKRMGLPARFANRLPAQKRGLGSAITTGLGAGPPPYVSILGGEFTLIDAGGQRQEIKTKYLDCVIFDANYEIPIQRVFWGDPTTTKFNPNADGYGPPVCYSDNGIGASAQAAEPQSTNCQTCRWNKFDFPSKIDPSKKTKACNAIKKLAVLPLSGKVDGEGTYAPEHIQAFPFLLRVPVMSHENLRVYGLKFQSDDVVFDIHEVVTRISFAPGKVGQLQFEATGFTDERTDQTIRKFLAEHHTDTLVGRGDVPIQKFLAEHHTDTLVGRGDVPWQGDPTTHAQERLEKAVDRLSKLPEPAATLAGNGANAAPKRSPGRPRKTESEPQPPAEGVPPFLRRTTQHASAPPSSVQGQAAGSPFGATAGTAHGIVQAEAPTSEMAAALDKVFGLKT
jgi:hypothetical protein